MSSIRSQGVREPTALDFLVAEGLLAPDSSPATYTWTSHNDSTQDDENIEEEVLYTKTCVVWSQGGVIRRIFKLHHDDQEITTALLTWFPPHDSHEASRTKPGEGPQEVKPSLSTTRPLIKPHPACTFEKSRLRALVIIVKQHAHIYYATGPSHIVNLGFEVAKAFPTPQGLLLERQHHQSIRKERRQSEKSEKKDFLSSPNLPRTTRRTSRGAPSAESASGGLSLADFVVESTRDDTDAMPRLFTLAGPYAQVGYVVEAQLLRSSKHFGQEQDPTPLPSDEEVLYISPSDETGIDNVKLTRPLIMAVTANQRTNTYSIWYASYPDTHSDSVSLQSQHSGERTQSRRRRSSFITRNTMNREGGTVKGKDRVATIRAGGLAAARSDVPSGASHRDGMTGTPLSLTTLEATLISPGKSKTRDRRTSSFLARAELPAHEQSPFADQSQTPRGLAGSLNSARRGLGASLEASARRSGPVTRSAAKARASIANGILQGSVDDDLEMDDPNESHLTALSQDMEAYDPFDDQNNDLVLTRFFERPLAEICHGSINIPSSGLASSLKVFTLLEPDRPRIGFDDVRVLNICIVHRESHRLADLAIKLRRMQDSTGCFFLPANDLLVKRQDGVLDATKIQDGTLSRMAQLVQDQAGRQAICVPPVWTFVNDIGDLYAPHGLAPDTTDDIRLPLPIGGVPACRFTRFDESLSNSGRVLLIDEDEVAHEVRVSLAPRHQLGKVFDAIQCALPRTASEAMLYTWWRVLSSRTTTRTRTADWQAIVITLFVLSLGYDDVDCRRQLGATHSHGDMWLLHLAQEAQAYLQSGIGQRERVKKFWLPFHEQRATLPPSTGPVSALPQILMLMHLLREEMKLDTLSAESTDGFKQSLTPVLAQLASWLGYAGWANHYMLEDDAMESCQFDQAMISGMTIPEVNAPFTTPPSIYVWLEAIMNNGMPSPFPSISSTRSGGSVGYRLIDQYVVPRTMALVNCVCKDHAAFHAEEERLVVETMLENSMDTSSIETLPEAIAVILREVLQKAMHRPSITWSGPHLALVRRRDLQLIEQDKNINIHPRVATSNVTELDTRSTASGASDMSGALDAYMKHQRRALMYIRQHNDKRVMEALDLLDDSRHALGEYWPRPGSTNKQFLDEQQAYVRLVYQRTLSKSTGLGMMNFSCYRPMPTEVIIMSAPNPTCRVMPSGSVFSAEVPHENKIGWAYFHTGVAAGLAIAKDAQGLEASWIVLNKPTESGVRHAGFLLGLGLSGHLKMIPRWLVFKYLTPKHDMTTIGLLLGASASRLGSMDQTITRLLSVHVPRLLPVGAAELNLSPLTQTAGLMSVGLLYYNTQHRRMSDILMSEIANEDQEHPINTNADTLSPKNEGYRLAAGYALGLINLGKGKDLRNLNGLDIEKRLINVATTRKDVQVIHVLDQAAAGAILAIAFIFLRTGDQTMARSIAVPDERPTIEQIRPDLLLLRAMAQNVILWNTIQPKLEWIRDNLPTFLRNGNSPQTFLDGRRLGTENMPLYNIVTGLCWSIALKYAGTGDETARDCVLTVYRKLSPAVPARTYDERIAKETLLRCQHHLLLSASTIMAGSEDLKVFRLLRRHYSRLCDEINFGLHQATTMAIGILFLGSGRCSFGSSNLAIAALMIAFYPLLPSKASDNRSHLQAFRHFWTFAVEPRCIVVRDYYTRQKLACPVKVELHDGRTFTISTPAMLPHLDTISRIITTDDTYWEVVLDFSRNPKHLEAFRKDQTIYCRCKPLLVHYESTFDLALTEIDWLNPNMNRTAQKVLRDVLRSTSGMTIHHGSDIFAWTADDSRDADVDAIRGAEIDGELDIAEHGQIPGLIDGRITPIDDVLMLKQSVNSKKRDALMGLRLLFVWAEKRKDQKLEWLNEEVIAMLKAEVLKRMEKEASTLAPTVSAPRVPQLPPLAA